MKHLIREEIISYGMLLMNIPKLNIPKRKNINYVSLCFNFSHIKSRLYKIANPVAVKKSNLLCTVVIGAIISIFMFSVSVMSQQLVSPWKEKFIQKDGNIIAYENYLETENQIYQPYGLVYHKAASAFYYKGKRVKVFLDERHLTKQEKITCPWMEKAWQYRKYCYFKDWNYHKWYTSCRRKSYKGRSIITIHQWNYYIKIRYSYGQYKNGNQKWYSQFKSRKSVKIST